MILAHRNQVDSSDVWDTRPVSKSSSARDTYPIEPKIALRPSPKTTRRKRRPPSSQALERPHQQNRTAQKGYKERNRRLMEEMRHTLVQYLEHY